MTRGGILLALNETNEDRALIRQEARPVLDPDDPARGRWPLEATP